jgi:hypothetical protein
MVSLFGTRLGTHARALTAALALLGLLPGLAHAAQPVPPGVPDTIKVPAGNVAFLVGHATGAQNYTCQQTSTGYTWVGVPSATLVDDKGKEIMTHYAGPTWESKDGSKVVAARVDGVTVSPDAIQWLLLRATPTTGQDDDGRLAGTTYIHRVNTRGGLAPTGGCDAAHVGATHSAPYMADYYFYRAKGSE